MALSSSWERLLEEAPSTGVVALLDIDDGTDESSDVSVMTDNDDANELFAASFRTRGIVGGIMSGASSLQTGLDCIRGCEKSDNHT